MALSRCGPKIWRRWRSETDGLLTHAGGRPAFSPGIPLMFPPSIDRQHMAELREDVARLATHIMRRVGPSMQVAIVLPEFSTKVCGWIAAASWGIALTSVPRQALRRQRSNGDPIRWFSGVCGLAKCALLRSDTETGGRRIMVRAQWKVMAWVVFTFAIASMAEASPAAHFASAMEPDVSGVSDFVVKVHGTHRPCRNGSLGRMGMEVGWHRHDRGKVYPCTPDSTGTQSYSSPTDRRARQGSGPETPAGWPGAPGSRTPEQKTGVSAVPRIVTPPRPSLSNPPTTFNRK